MPESPNTTPPQALTQEQIADPLWYKDAVIYQLHIKAFFDSTNDGIGTFAGLSAKLDYLVSLGVTAVWLLPFYPSPLRDDGYDIADYRSVNPSYGTVRDFREFVKAAHRRGLKVITELVINHTSDQHPWFQKARRARRGSAARDFYVWSDDDKKWPETRIIFCDTETSNWTWDPVAQQYYWHRFFSHQPDLNFDNPRVLEEVQRVMKFWFDMGVDGMRLDAIPYLVERDGTNNENLAETHAVIKKLRAYVDENFEGRMLLGEANQWPEDVLPYFGEGEGDECNMAFHFPLMPRMYMALAQEDRHPITDIMRQTPDIPAKAQWAVFLRNHDELTLEMVTDRERDYLWNYYAAEPRARINMGIRRRLAPLVDNDRRKIELLNSLLMSMPGTPIVYYGDEIGMGDNIYLGDRDGVRTPMQWSPDRNGGFSKANPQKLYLPAVADPVYGFQSVNVEAQQGNPSSLLNWMRRLISVRKNHRSFGRGALRFLYPGNRKVLAYLREFEGETILCVANLSRAAQPAELDLSEFEGRVPLELLGRSVFPPVGELPYFVTLPAYAFYWFLLADETAAPEWHEDVLAPLPEFVTVVTADGWKGVLSGRGADTLQGQALPAFLPNQRWFGAKGARIDATTPAAAAPFEAGGQSFLLSTWTVALRGQGTQTYQMPLGMAWESRDFEPLSHLATQTVAKVRRGPRVGVIYDAAFDDTFAPAFARAILAGGTLDAGAGRTIRLEPTEAGRALELAEDCHAARLGKEQSNSSVRIGEEVVLKVYRRLDTGIHPEIELGRHLTDVAGFANIPPVYGHAVLEAAEGGPETSTALAVLQGFVRNQGDGWSYVMDYLDRFFDEAELPKPQEEEDRAPPHAFIETLIHTLGRRTGEMHRAFALPSDDPAFTPEPITDADLADWRAQVHAQAAGAKKALTQAAKAADGARREEIAALLDDWKAVEARIDALLTGPVEALKTRFHGDFHLGQVVLVRDDFYLLDFEGEPARPLADRRHKHSPLKDVAGMVRSFDYAAWAALFKRSQLNINAMDTLAPHARAWESQMVKAFQDGYGEAVAGVPVRPDAPEAARRLLDAFVLEKSLYEVCYEAANRPDWLRIPLKGVRRVLSEEDR